MDKRFTLTVCYDIPESGLYEHDLLAAELAGVKSISWGTFMFSKRILEYKYPDEESLNIAHKKFLESGEFRLYPLITKDFPYVGY